MANPKYRTDRSIDIDELIRQSKANTPFVDDAVFEQAKKNSAIPQPKVAKEATSDDAPDIIRANTQPASTTPQVPQVDVPKTPVAGSIPGLILEEEPVSEPEETYDGPGIVMTKEEYEQSKGDKGGVNVSGIKPETMESTKQYLKDMDNQIEELKQRKEEMEAKGIAPAPKSSPQSIVNIYIDKAQVGEIALTPEQQKKVEMAQKIVLNETTELSYKTIKIHRPDVDKDTDRKRKDTVIKRAFDRTLSPFIALGSGYLGKMANCSVAEIMRLGRQIDSGRNLQSELERWSLLYNKMKYCSIGEFETFDDFLKNTAYTDYDNLQFAVICASFPADTTLQFTCPNCSTKEKETRFNYTVKNKDLLRTDLVDQSIADQVYKIIDSDTFIERAKEVHENSWMNKVTRMSANEEDNLIMMDLYIPSAYDAIHRTYEQLTNPKKNSQDYDTYVDLIRMIKAVYIADEDEDTGEPVYYQFEDVNDIFDIISNFTDAQLNRIAQFVQNSYLAHQYYYGIKDVVCPQCGHHLGEYPMNMDTLLFHKVRPQ